MIPPQLKLALVFGALVKNHGYKVLHLNNVDALTKDLSNALKAQKDILADSRRGVLTTAYDVLPVIVEVKLLSNLVARKMEIDTKDKSPIDVLEAIVAKSEERGKPQAARGIKETLEWTRVLFKDPDIQEVLKMEMPEIDKPGFTPRRAGRFVAQLVSRSASEITRVNEFLKRAKDLEPPQDNNRKAPAPAPKT